MKASITTYILGFLFSIILTVAAYFMVVDKSMGSVFTTAVILALAFLQLFIQLYFFLHLGRDSKARLHLIFFIITFGLVLTVIVGSIWIMYHLNYNMTPQQINNYLQDQNGF